MSGRARKQPSGERKPEPSAKEKKKHTNELLDEALEETFPASDPPAMLEPVPNSKRRRRKGA